MRQTGCHIETKTLSHEGDFGGCFENAAKEHRSLGSSCCSQDLFFWLQFFFYLNDVEGLKNEDGLDRR